MALSSEEMPEFRALPYRDKWRVNRSLARGEAPEDPRLVAAAVELAERHLQSPGRATLMRGLTLLLAVAFGALAILAATKGEHFSSVFYGLISVVHLGQLMLNPVARPKHMAKALEDSRRIAAAIP
jgi:hypothetical protein